MMKLIFKLTFLLLVYTIPMLVDAAEDDSKPVGYSYIGKRGADLVSKADKGDSEAQWEVAWWYYKGSPPFRLDYKKAYEYWLRAAKSGHAKSVNRLGLMFEEGKAVEKNDRKAVICYTQAASLKDFYGSMDLARKYWNGEGIVQDYTVAYALNVVAAPQNNSLAYTTQINRSKLEKGLTLAEVEDAKKLAKELTKSTNYFITIEKYLNAHGKVGFSKPLLAFELD